jgi:hypothetical protein
MSLQPLPALNLTQETRRRPLAHGFSPRYFTARHGRWRCSLRNLHRDEGERDLGRSSPEYRERKAHWQSAAVATSYRSRTVQPNPALTQAFQKRIELLHAEFLQTCLLPVALLKDPPAAGFAFVFVRHHFKHALLLLFGWGAALAALKPDPSGFPHPGTSSSRRSRLSPSQGRLAAARPSHSQPRGLLVADSRVPGRA